MTDAVPPTSSKQELRCRRCGESKALDGYYRSGGTVQQPCAECRSQQAIARKNKPLIKCDQCEGLFTTFGLTHHKRVKHGAPPKQRADHHGYIRTYSPQHRREKPVHRLVMEGVIGRALSPQEHVHHKNGDHLDNRPENLEILSQAEHRRLHSTPLVSLVCPFCGTARTLRAQVVKHYKTGACGKCRYKHMADIKAMAQVRRWKQEQEK